ncbi:MAG: hypothetical protein J7603_12905, partial [Pseudacidovorax sp.]|nr:hypothetical protein [Pseudacidovorax sp.]
MGDDLTPSLRTFNAAQDSSAEDLSKDEIHIASRWAEAFDKAHIAGMRDISEFGEAYFSVHSNA